MGRRTERCNEALALFLDFGLAEYLVNFAAVGAFELRHILDQCDNGYINYCGHVHSLFDYIGTSSCGLHYNYSFIGRDWNTVRGTSPVPGGISTNI